MNNDENKEAVQFLFDDDKRQQERFKAADERIKLMQSDEVRQVRSRGYDDLPLWLR